MYIYKYELLADFNLAAAKVGHQTQNLIPHQIFQLFGNIIGREIGGGGLSPLILQIYVHVFQYVLHSSQSTL